MQVKSGVGSRKTNVRVLRGSTRLKTPAPAKAALRKDWPWHPFPVGTITALKEAGFAVLDRDDGQLIHSGGKAKHNLVHVRRTTEGAVLAQSGGNTPVGRPSAFHAMAAQARVRLDRALLRLAKGGPIDSFVATMKTIRADLAKASVVKPPKAKAAHIPSGILLNPEERSSSVRAAPAGLPTLGKRR